MEDLHHQAVDLAANGHKLYWGRLWEMGVGKTRPTLREAALLYLEGLIRVLVIVAPKAVALNWIHDQVPKHLDAAARARCFAYEVPKARTRDHEKSIEQLLTWKAQARGLVVLSISYEGIMSEAGQALLVKLMDGQAMLVADESSYIGNNDAKRTKRMYSLGGLAQYRRILEGTPVTNDPRNVYSQMKFLAPDYWDKAGRHVLGFPILSFTEFTATFCKIVKSANFTTTIKRKGRDGKVREIRIQIPKVVGYQRLDELNKMLLLGASRLTTEDAGIWLPEKTYQRLRFNLHPKQRAIYQDLRKRYMTELEGGQFVSAPEAMVRLLRLQQVTSGYLPTLDERGEQEMTPLLSPGENPRLELLLEHLGLVPHQTIVFARFTPEVDMIMDALGSQAVRFDGETSDRERVRSLEAFQGGVAKFLIGKIGAAGRGLTLTCAKRTVYYSNEYKYGERAQSEKRAHRIGQLDPCFYDDLEAIDTVDGGIISSLKRKDVVASQVTGDQLKEWLTE